MSKGTKITLAIVGVLAMFGGCGSCGFMFWLISWSNDTLEVTDMAATEGDVFGRSHTSSACIEEALARTDVACSGIDLTCYSGGEEFLTACLRATAVDDPGLCTDVPASGFIATGDWATERCQSRGYYAGHGCETVLHGVVRHCAIAGGTLAAYP